MTKHTPGPWWTDAKYIGTERLCSIIAARTDCGPLPGNPTRGMVAFATAQLNTGARVCEANARLIAAAPDLLAALEVVLAETGYSAHDDQTEWPDFIRQAAAAIANAKERCDG